MGHFGVSLGCWRASWGVLKAFRGDCGAFRDILGSVCYWKAFWGGFGAFWGDCGGFRDALGSVLDIGRHFGVV